MSKASSKNLGYNIYPIDMVLGEDPKEYSKYGATCFGKMSTLAMSVIVGILELIYVTVTLTGLIYAMSTGEEEYRKSQPVFSDAMPYQSMPSLLGLNILWFIFLIFLFWGIKTVQPLMVIPQMVIQAIAVVAALALFCTNLWALISGDEDAAEDIDGGLSIAVLLLMLLLLIIQILCLYVMIRLYKFLREEHRKIMSSGPLSVPPLHSTWAGTTKKFRTPSPENEDND